MFIKNKEKIYHDDISKQKMELLHLESEEVSSLAFESEEEDYLLNGQGDFGHFYKNPILTNGDYGTLIYLGKLMFDKTRTFLLFHKIGSITNVITNIGKIDVYEILDETGTNWDIFFIDKYHQRRSNLTPKGYEFLDYNKEVGDTNIALGTTKNCNNFPFDLTTHLISDFNKKNIEVLKLYKEWEKKEVKIIRPPEHLKKINVLETVISKQK